VLLLGLRGVRVILVSDTQIEVYMGRGKGEMANERVM
jgi:hypothetical protein